MMIYTKCDQELVRKMLEFCELGSPYFSKAEFLDTITYERKIHEVEKIDSLVWQIAGIYHALSRMGYIKKNGFNRVFPNTERMREGLRYLLKCTPSIGLLRRFRESMKQIHFLEFDAIDPEELRKFKQLMRDEIR